MANVWKIAPGEHAEDWQVFRQRGCIGLGWLTGSDYGSFSKTEVLRALEHRYGKKSPGNGRGAAKMIWSFVHDVKRDDVVVANERYNRVVGIGVVRGGYLPPTSPQNPMRGDQSTHRHHVRQVQWVISKPVDLDGDRFFVQATLGRLGAEKVGRIRQAYLDAYPDDSEIRASLAQLFGLAEAERQLKEENAFDPTGIEDARERVFASIVRRRGQPGFRDRLLAAYQGRCAVTGCAVEAVLEAAHIIPYKGEQTNLVGNGLLLRSDWHTLFDLRLVTVDAATLCVLVSPNLAGSGYDDFHGKPLRVPDDPASRPSRKALKQHQQESDLRG
jgi:hypothetical protein